MQTVSSSVAVSEIFLSEMFELPSGFVYVDHVLDHVLDHVSAEWPAGGLRFSLKQTSSLENENQFLLDVFSVQQ